MYFVIKEKDKITKKKKIFFEILKNAIWADPYTNNIFWSHLSRYFPAILD